MKLYLTRFLANLALIGDFCFRFLDAYRAHVVPSQINSLVMILLIGFLALGSIKQKWDQAAVCCHWIGICLICDLIPIFLITPHRFTMPYIFSHLAIACFYMGLGKDLKESVRKHVRSH